MAKKEINQFVCGFAIALIEAYKLHSGDAEGICRDTIQSVGYTLDHFKEAGLDREDLAVLKKIMTR
jgi:hypothetical protein